MRIRFLSNANFHSTMICSPKNWMNCDIQPAGWVICRGTNMSLWFFRCLNLPLPTVCSSCVPLLTHLHFWVHTAVDGGNTPGGAGGDQTVSCRGEDGLLILVEGLQGRILARTLQLESKTEKENECQVRVNQPFLDLCH